MVNATLSQAHDGRWVIKGELGFTTATEVLKASAAYFSDARQVVIDLQEVKRADSAALALLLEWLRAAERNGKRVTFINVPGQLRAIAGLCGLDEVLSFDGE